ncbi:hypothetical protein HC891_12055 [Candidatus Gracilibacteria bacterium]|nr:hypothetical protein [Candidatus Gracilibacteria bacterium]
MGAERLVLEKIAERQLLRLIVAIKLHSARMARGERFAISARSGGPHGIMQFERHGAALHFVHHRDEGCHADAPAMNRCFRAESASGKRLTGWASSITSPTAIFSCRKAEPPRLSSVRRTLICQLSSSSGGPISE